LRAIGVNLNFAPVLDVASNPKNPIIGDRALSADPEEVFELGWEIARGLREGGVIPCVKHFPGHGDTDADSHVELPVVDKEIEERYRRIRKLKKRALTGFSGATEDGLADLIGVQSKKIAAEIQGRR